ncbi:MAG: glycosyltransferase [Gemmataceae bacterium]|nr:glycosyltransferase [Gemmataceae bacterium]
MPAPSLHHGSDTAQAVEIKPARAKGVALSVILPVYNEAATLDATLDAVLAFAAGRPDVRFVFVCDGATDQSEEILRRRLAGHDRCELRAYQPNRGKGYAVAYAIREIDSPLVMFMDGDLAYSLDHIDDMLAALATADVVIGSRRESPEERRNTRKFRRLSGWCFNRLVRVGLGLPFADTQAGLKGFRLEAAREIFSRLRLSGFAFDVEALFLARRLGFSIAEIPARVSRSHRRKPSNVSMWREPVRMAGSLLRVRWNAITGRYRGQNPPHTLGR